MSNIGVLDYGAGNLMNVLRAIKHLGFSHQLIQSPNELCQVDKLVIPGVGAYKVAMDAISELGFLESIQEYAAGGKPILGICLGMQLLFERSFEFGETPGLALLEGEVTKISDVSEGGEKHKIPHMGWNELTIHNREYPIIIDIEDGVPVYFVHSYMASLRDQSLLLASCKYGGIEIPSVVGKANIFGCQFHPEKSGEIGLAILKNFLGTK